MDQINEQVANMMVKSKKRKELTEEEKAKR